MNEGATISLHNHVIADLEEEIQLFNDLDANQKNLKFGYYAADNNVPMLTWICENESSQKYDVSLFHKVGALLAASMHGYAGVVKVILDTANSIFKEKEKEKEIGKGKEKETKDEYFSTVHAALGFDHKEITQLLLTHENAKPLTQIDALELINKAKELNKLHFLADVFFVDTPFEKQEAFFYLAYNLYLLTKMQSSYSSKACLDLVKFALEKSTLDPVSLEVRVSGMLIRAAQEKDVDIMEVVLRHTSVAERNDAYNIAFNNGNQLFCDKFFKLLENLPPMQNFPQAQSLVEFHRVDGKKSCPAQNSQQTQPPVEFNRALVKATYEGFKTAIKSFIYNIREEILNSHSLKALFDGLKIYRPDLFENLNILELDKHAKDVIENAKTRVLTILRTTALIRSEELTTELVEKRIGELIPHFEPLNFDSIAHASNINAPALDKILGYALLRFDIMAFFDLMQTVLSTSEAALFLNGFKIASISEAIKEDDEVMLGLICFCAQIGETVNELINKDSFVAKFIEMFKAYPSVSENKPWYESTYQMLGELSNKTEIHRILSLEPIRDLLLNLFRACKNSTLHQAICADPKLCEAFFNHYNILQGLTIYQEYKAMFPELLKCFDELVKDIIEAHFAHQKASLTLQNHTQDVETLDYILPKINSNSAMVVQFDDKDKKNKDESEQEISPDEVYTPRFKRAKLTK